MDRNDNPPRFVKSVMQASVEENKKPGESVTVVTASDADEGKNREIHYRLAPGEDEALFTVSTPLEAKQISSFKILLTVDSVNIVFNFYCHLGN